MMPGPSCPECGGITQFNPSMRRIVCKSCGLSFTRDEFEEMKEKLRKTIDTYSEPEDDFIQRKKRKKRPDRKEEYLDWWTSEHGDKD